jgi:hypothetical protein
LEKKLKATPEKKATKATKATPEKKATKATKATPEKNSDSEVVTKKTTRKKQT